MALRNMYDNFSNCKHFQMNLAPFSTVRLDMEDRSFILRVLTPYVIDSLPNILSFFLILTKIELFYLG